jgi:hypothetical protein
MSSDLSDLSKVSEGPNIPGISKPERSVVVRSDRSGWSGSLTKSGWWFGTKKHFSIIYWGIILPTDFHIFQRD